MPPGGTAIEIHDSVEPIEAEWRELALRSEASPFQHPGWTRAWWQAFGEGVLSIVALRRDGALAGVLPMRRHGRTFSSVTNVHTPAFAPVVADRGAELELLRFVFAQGMRRVDLSYLTELPQTAEISEAMAGYRVLSGVLMQSPYVEISGDWESYWSGLSKNLRSTVRRSRKRLSERGEVTLDVSGGQHGLGDLLEQGFRLEASGWKGEQGTAILSRPDTRLFYESLSRWAAEEGFLRLIFLRVDGVPVAFHLSLEAGDRHYMLKPGHDVALDSFGPGTVLTAEVVSRAFSLGLRSYEFLGGPDRYKLRWSKLCRHRFRLQAFARSPTGALDRIFQTRGRAAVKVVLRRGH